MEIKKFYKVDEVAKMLQVTRRTIYSYMKQGKLHAVKIGQYWHISQDNLDAFLEGDKQI